MKKLDFLVSDWSGEASAARGPGMVVELNQTEVAQFKLDGLVLMIEGVGRTKSAGKLALQVLGLISFDDAKNSCRMRAYNDGPWLETDVKLLEEGKGLSWGFSPRGDQHEIALADQRERRMDGIYRDHSRHKTPTKADGTRGSASLSKVAPAKSVGV